MNRLILLALLAVACGIGLPARAQAPYVWQPLNAPSALSRYDDMAWRSPQRGYAIDFAGTLARTIDGGQSWQSLPGPGGTYFRSLAFLTDQVGFLGKLQTYLGGNPADTTALYRTLDGGQTWTGMVLPINNALQGLCGMSAVNDSVLWACGRYNGPVQIYKTTNAGQTWQYFNVSQLAGGLVDCYFWSPDSGFVVGSTGHYDNSNGVILATTDGGQTWSRRFVSTHVGDLCWKMTFPTRRVGYVSIEDFNGGNLYCLKTTDRGLTWREVRYGIGSNFNAEGIGFLNDSVGWIGGNYNDPLMYWTTNGGRTWASGNLAQNINRFRFFGDSLGYASGTEIYRIRPSATLGLAGAPAVWPMISAPFPNPASGTATWPLQLAGAATVDVWLTDAFGREVVHPLRDKRLPTGMHTVDLPLGGLPPGLYHAHLLLVDNQYARRAEVRPVIVP